MTRMGNGNHAPAWGEWTAWVRTLTPADLPKAPFALVPHVDVADPYTFLTALQRDAEAGPEGPRARLSAFERECQLLRAAIAEHGAAGADQIERPEPRVPAAARPRDNGSTSRKAQRAKPRKTATGPEEYQARQSPIAGAIDVPVSVTLVAFDFETTGLSPSLDAIVEVGGVKFDPFGEVIDTYQQLADPGSPIPEDSTAVTGITNKMVKGQPPSLEVVQAFLEWAGPDAVLIAHNAPFDIEFLRASCDRGNVKAPNLKVVDTLRWAQQMKLPTENNKLGTLLAHYEIAVDGDLHRSLVDAQGVVALVTRLAGGTLNPLEEILHHTYDLKDNVYNDFKFRRKN